MIAVNDQRKRREKAEEANILGSARVEATPLPVVLQWLREQRLFGQAQIYGNSLKYMLARLPVLKLYLPEETLSRLDQEEPLKGALAGALKESLKEPQGEYLNGKGRLLVRLPGFREDFHLLLLSQERLRRIDNSNYRLHFSIEKLRFKFESGEWEGSAEEIADLQKGMLRAINLDSPASLTTEAILRAIAVSAQLDFDLEKRALAAMKEAYNPSAARRVSRKFLHRQFRKILGGLKPSRAFIYMDQIGALDWFLPELAAARGLSQNRYHRYDVFYHSIYTCDHSPQSSLILRLAGLLHDIGKPNTRRVKKNGEATFHNHEIVGERHAANILRRFGFKREISERVCFLVRNHMFHYTEEWTDKAVRRFIRKVDAQSLEDLIQLRLADRKGSGKHQRLPQAIRDLQEHIGKVHLEAEKLKVTDLKINGDILMKIGMKPGPEMGILLKAMLAAVEGGQLPNEAEALLEEAKTALANGAII